MGKIIKNISYIILLLLVVACNNETNDRTLQTGTDGLNLNADTLAAMEEMLYHGIADSAYPGFVFLATKDGKIFYTEAGGHFTYDKNSTPMTLSTIFDMASITKVVATTSAAMLLYDQGKLKLDQKVSDVLPGFAAHGKENVTFYHLLTHSSGLPAWDRLWEDTNSPEEMVEKIFNMQQQQPEGEKMVYSCLGFITLGKAIEKITGQSLDTFLENNLFEPLRMTHTFFNPDEKYYSQIAPTEFDKNRGGIQQGKVHDENAYYIGGVSGNAGLFSNAEDLAVFCQMMLNKGIYNGERIFKTETVELFTQLHEVNGNVSRGLGWGKATGKNSAGKYFSESAFGHTGFTGTALWIDPSNQLVGIFLTNRVFATRNNQKLYQFRSKVFDKLQQAVSN